MATTVPELPASPAALEGRPLSRKAVEDWHVSALALIGAVGMVVLLCLFARVMSEPLRHDEHIYFAAAVLLGEFTLYQDISFSHLPNLPILLRGFMEVVGGDYLFLTARFFAFFCWVAFIPAFFLLCWELSKNLAIALLCVLLLVTNTLIVDHVGMLVAAHLLPICLASYGFLFFLRAVHEQRFSSSLMVLSGIFLSLAVGTKSNYIIVIPPFVIAAFCLPGSMPFSRRLMRGVLPLALGGIIGGLPTLYYLVGHTDVFLFNVLDFHLGPHRSYWSEPANAASVTGLTLGERIVYAYRLWGSGSSVLLLVAVVYFAALLFIDNVKEQTASSRRDYWPVLVTLALTVLGALICFVIKPSFPQYYMPPLPFAIILIAALAGLLTKTQRVAVHPLVMAIALSTLMLGGPKLAQSLPNLLAPSTWTGVKVQQTAVAMRGAIGDRSEGKALVATLAPIYALEAGFDVYPELASGPFYYRIGDYLSEEDRQRYQVTSPSTVDGLLDQQPPVAILVGHEGALDAPLIDYAHARGYVLVDAPIGRDRYGESMLYLKPRVPARTSNVDG